MWKKVLFTFLVTGVFFTVLELVLFVCGVQPVLYEEDPYVGFSSQVPLLVERAGPDGQAEMVTADNKLSLFNRQRFPKTKAAGAYRIFCLGGSTTYGRPYDDTTSFCGWLRELLPAADPSKKWEVINAGGISYASYRVAIVTEQLIRYEPDLFIIYSGQNEFLERRTYQRIFQIPPPVRGLGALASHTRTYAALRRLTRASSPARQNLPGEVNAVLDESVGPEDYHRDEPFQQQVLAHYQYNLARMVDIARSAGAQVMLVTPASNLRHCSPFKSQHRAELGPEDLPQWQALVDGAEQSRESGRLREALDKLDQAAKIDDRHARLHYLRGRVLLGLKRYDASKTAFVRARDEDVCPLRALTPMRQIVVDVAAQRKVPLVDFVAIVQQRSEHGIPGEDFFLDHVHPTIEGNRLLALALLDKMVSLRIAKPNSSWGENTIKQVSQQVESRIDRQAHGIALRNLSIVLGWAGKFEEARKLAEQARQMVPDDAEAHYRAGAHAQRLGKLDQAKAAFLRAIQLQPDHAQAHSKLGALLHQTGNTAEAMGHFQQAIRSKPDYADGHINLGVVLQSQGKLAQARAKYEDALRVRPNNANAHYNLAGVLESQGNLVRSAEHYRQALQSRPHYAEAHNNLGLVLERQGKLDQALSHYQQATRILPTYAEAQCNVGVILLHQGKPAQAIQQFEQALRIRPDYDYARQELKKALAMQGGP